MIATPPGVLDLEQKSVLSFDSEFDTPIQIDDRERKLELHEPATQWTATAAEHSDSSDDSSALEKPNILFPILLTALLSCGGFVYGYDTGTVSGFLNMPAYKAHFGDLQSDGQYAIPSTRSGLMVSLFTIGALLGGLISTRTCDAYGRRITIAAADLVYVVGLVIQMTAGSRWRQMTMGRFVTGIAAGGFMNAVPMLISETVTSEIRGPAVSCYQYMLTLGIFVGNCICYGFQHTHGTKSYLIPLAIGYAIAAFLCLAMLVAKESPRHLIAVGKPELAAQAVGYTVRLPADSAYVRQQVARMEHSVSASQKAGTAPWSELWTGSPRYLYRLVVSVLLLSLMQLNGANYFFYYGTVLFKSIGTDNPFATSMIITGVNMVCTVLGLFFVKRFTRRTVLLYGGALSFVAFIVFASLGGFALFPHGESQPADKTVGRVMIFFCCLFIFAAASSWSMLGVTVVTEILPQRIRGKAMGIASTAFWLWTFCIGFFTPMITDSIGYKYGYVFCGCLLVAIVFAYTNVHETKGLTLEEIDDMYASGIDAKASAKYVREFKREVSA